LLLGCTAGTVVGDGHEVEDAPALSLWVGRVPTWLPFRLHAARPFPAPDELPPDVSAVVLLTDPFTYDANEAVARRGRARDRRVGVGRDAPRRRAARARR